MADRLLQRMAERERTYQASAAMSPRVVVGEREPDFVRVRGEWERPQRGTSTETRRPGSVTEDESWEPVGLASTRSQVGPAVAVGLVTWLGGGSLLFPAMLGISDFLARNDWLFNDGIPKPFLVSFWMSGIVGALAFASNLDFFKNAIYRERKFVERVEEATGLDLNRDGHVGQPARRVRLEVSEDNGRHESYLDLPVDLDKLVPFARGVLAGRPTSEREWTGSDGLLDQGQYRELRDELLLLGLSRWNNEAHKNQGWALTRKGEAVFRELAKTPLP